MTIAQQFLELFKGLERAHGSYQTVGGVNTQGKVGGQAKTLKEIVTVEIWKAHLAGKVGLGIVPIDDENFCHFGAIDIDVYNLDLTALEALVNRIGLPLVVCRTKSGGAHLYLFLSEPTPAAFVRDHLMEWAVLLGYPQVEIFPKQAELGGEDDVGSWINMPYFAGARTTRYALKKGEALSPEEFLTYAAKLSTTAKTIGELKLKTDEELVGGPPCLQHLARAGFPEGTRNKGLFNLAIFCKMKYGDSWQVKAGEMNKRYLIPPLKDKEVEGTLKSVGRKDYFYKCSDPPISLVCNRSICARREFGLKRSGEDPGIIMDGMIKILTDPPMWLLNVDGKRLTLPSSEDFLSQNRFTKACVDSFNILPNRIKDNVWRNLIKDLLSKAEPLPAPEDAGLRGEFLSMIERFCTERAGARSAEEMLLGKPFTENERTYFRSMDLLEWLRKKKFMIESRKAWNILRELKAGVKTFKIKGKFFRAWAIPAFSTQTEPLEVPSIKDQEF